MFAIHEDCNCTECFWIRKIDTAQESRQDYVMLTLRVLPGDYCVSPGWVVDCNP